MQEHVLMAKINQGKLAKVGMRSEILESMQLLSLLDAIHLEAE